jgi:hypothetical protein
MVCYGIRYIRRWTRARRWALSELDARLSGPGPGYGALTEFDAFLSGSGVVRCPIIGLDVVPWMGKARYTCVPLTGAGGRFPACPLRQRRDSTTPVVLLVVCVLQRAGVCVVCRSRFHSLNLFFCRSNAAEGETGRKEKKKAFEWKP